MKLGDLAARLGARLEGDPAREIDGAATLEGAGATDVTFYANPRYRAALTESRAAAVLLDETTAENIGEIAPDLLVHPNPYAGFARALTLFNPTVVYDPGVRPGAVVEEGAEVDPTATVLPLAFVGTGARIGPRTVVHPQAYVGPGAVIGADCIVQPSAVIRERCVLGDRVVLQPGAIIGGDGFGYALDQGESGPFHRKVPQVGIVRIEDDVEVGAGACVDRATTGETVVGRGAKLDNLVQVGHNSVIGPLSIVCGLAGLAGSTRLGTGVIVAGGAGLAGHLEVGDGARIGAASGVSGDVPEGATYTGYPAMEHTSWLRTMAALKKLPQIVRRVRALERKRPRD